ncbi:uncharacterized protein LOC113312367 [Papaver somniferum]|uniref:uncharacterized protein LOC113312367 n=1 Tax=Papaver somniferum TaxID=3469 RepID=UPI000E6F5BDF|nr:uncharacterized protein LOC113312367 [Papaver somniferum]
MGLPEHWVKLINQCVSTVSYSVLLNGSPTGLIKPERGLRQGDPLSPYIYIIFSEALSSYIDALTRKGFVEGIKNGRFTYKSAYLGLRRLRPSPCSALWKCIWKINVPYRIQVFSWKAARNALPARTVLHTRMPMNYVDCTRCNDPSESIMQALVFCPFASRVWFLSSFCVNTQAFSTKSFMDWMLFWLVNLVYKLPDGDQRLFVAILWSLWQSRNNLVFQNIKENYTDVLMRAITMLLTRKSTLSFVMRDFTNTASFCASIVFQVESVEEAEGRSIWAALQKAVEQKLTHPIIESDAQSLINQFSAGMFDGNSRTDAIFKDIQFFSSKFVACLFVFQPRTCNSVAHELVH